MKNKPFVICKMSYKLPNYNEYYIVKKDRGKQNLQNDE